MPKPSRTAIDDEIVDRAAALFARHGYGATSLQQVADSVGYSKTGLLHRFASKEALHSAAVTATRARISTAMEPALELPDGDRRDRTVLIALVDLTLAWPGIAALMLVAAEGDPARASEELVEAGLAVAAGFGIDVSAPDEDRIVRVLSATAGLTAAALRAQDLGLAQQWRNLIVETAMNTLGHRTPERRLRGSSH